MDANLGSTRKKRQGLPRLAAVPDNMELSLHGKAWAQQIGLGLTLTRDDPRGPLHLMTGTLLAAIAKFLSGASVRWIDCQPDTCQRIYFANHTSHLDALVLWRRVPPDVRAVTRPVAAKDYWERGRIRRYLARQVFNALLIDRKEIKVHQSPVDLMIREIGDSKSLIVFPEGHRNTDGDMDEFQERAVLPGQETPGPGIGAGVPGQYEPGVAARRVLAGAAVELHHVWGSDLAGKRGAEDRLSQARHGIACGG